MTGGALKTAICVSLLAHVAGYLVFTRLARPHSSEVALPVGQLPALTIIANSDVPSGAAPSQVPPALQPVQPVQSPTPEVAAVKPPELETVPAPVTPVTEPVQAEPSPLPDSVAVPSPANPAPIAQPVAEPSPAVSVPAKTAVQSAKPTVAPTGGSVVLARAKPDYRKRLDIPYPAAAKRRREEGEVVVTVLMDARGHPTTVQLRQSSGYRLLDDAAVNAIRLWEFQPVKIDGQAVATEVEVPVDFKLADPRP